MQLATFVTSIRKFKGPGEEARATNRAFEQIADPLLQDVIGGQTDRIFDPFCLQIFVNFGVCEAGFQQLLCWKSIMSILDGYLSEAELANELNLNKATLMRWRKKQIGPPFTIIGRGVFYSRDSVLLWLKKQEVSPPVKHVGRETGHTQRLRSFR